MCLPQRSRTVLLGWVGALPEVRRTSLEEVGVLRCCCYGGSGEGA
jgi:hypothetical protein